MPDLDDKALSEIKAALYNGRKIEAVKVYRDAMPGTDLVDAKKAVEDLQAKLQQEHPEQFASAAKEKGCLGMILVLAGLASGLGLLAMACQSWV